jgi:NADPH2:quinone reductase
MKAMRVHAWGEAPVLEMIPEPLERDAHSIVRIEAASVGHLDRTIWRGEFLHPPPLPWVPGVEGSGVVKRSRSLAAGTRVWFRGGELGTRGDGTWCERHAVPDSILGVLPDEVSFEAGRPSSRRAPLAWVALHEVGGLRAGERVLVTGATGAVGSIACQFAAAAGADVTGVVGKAARVAQLAEGVRPIVVDRGDPRVPQGVQADLLIDTVGGATLAALLPSAVAGGRVVLVGYLGSSRLVLDLTQFIQHDVSLLPLNMLRREAAGRAAAPKLLERIAEDALCIEHRVFDFAQAGEALEWLGSPDHRGRAVLRWGG